MLSKNGKRERPKAAYSSPYATSYRSFRELRPLRWGKGNVQLHMVAPYFFAPACAL